jgi:hypothetical protein
MLLAYKNFGIVTANRLAYFITLIGLIVTELEISHVKLAD